VVEFEAELPEEYETRSAPDSLQFYGTDIGFDDAAEVSSQLDVEAPTLSRGHAPLPERAAEPADSGNPTVDDSILGLEPHEVEANPPANDQGRDPGRDPTPMVKQPRPLAPRDLSPPAHTPPLVTLSAPPANEPTPAAAVRRPTTRKPVALVPAPATAEGVGTTASFDHEY